ncbi:FG-GAP repeat domain-containing protein [Planobispora takensis]|uniref:FG-GAP repeat protein n=1 Tax=Planobispora takensis TaxID=1367882 RepID=A0A8J3T3M8_9ACTN|nr:FG-GAP and VCBS repeat-containing protein [Planobispora takensis]GII03450.1 hypothetical protein Pta02_54580 [Planobispora takensis]
MRVKKIRWWAALLAALTTPVTLPAAPAAAAPITVDTDFNGDGYNDLAVGSQSYPGHEGTGHSGLITVLYGGPNGLTGRHLIRPEPDCFVVIYNCSGWGRSLTAGDADGDGKIDLVSAGSADLQIHSWTAEGVTRKLRWSGRFIRDALTVGRVDHADPRPDIVGGYAEGYGQVLGGWYNGGSFETAGLSSTRRLRPWSMTIGDIHGDGLSEAMWVGIDVTNGPSGTYVWYSGNLRNPSADPWVLGGPEGCQAPETSRLACPKNDSVVTLGDVNGDGYRDLVMVTPSTGTLNVWYGDKYGGGMSRVGYSARGLTWLTTLSTTSQLNLATGDVNGDGAAEISIGVPRATVSGRTDAGALVLIPGSGTGPVPSAAQVITQDGVAPPDASPTADPIGEQSAEYDNLGAAVSIIDLTGDGKGELIAGAPGKNGNRGMLVVLPGTATGVPSTAQVLHAQDAGATADRARFAGTLLH